MTITADEAVDTAADVALDLARAATAAHVALAVGWPFHARELALAAARLAARLEDDLAAACTDKAWHREQDQRRSGTEDALAELQRRHRARLGQQLADTDTEGSTP